MIQRLGKNRNEVGQSLCRVTGVLLHCNLFFCFVLFVNVLSFALGNNRHCEKFCYHDC